MAVSASVVDGVLEQRLQVSRDFFGAKTYTSYWGVLSFSYASDVDFNFLDSANRQISLSTAENCKPRC